MCSSAPSRLLLIASVCLVVAGAYILLPMGSSQSSSSGRQEEVAAQSGSGGAGAGAVRPEKLGAGLLLTCVSRMPASDI